MKNSLNGIRSLGLALVGTLVFTSPGFAESTQIVEATAKVAAAAEKFLAGLSETQRAAVKYPFSDEEQKAKWSNLPEPMYHRHGLRLGDLTAAQREAAMSVLAATLSPMGYQKVVEIVEADEVLRKDGNPPNIVFGKDEFYLSFVGAPSATTPWIVQFGGHHLALNATLAGSHGILTPSLTAAQPAIYKVDGKTVRPLGRESDKSFVVINALNEEQKKQAILGSAFRDLVLGPGHDGKTIAPEGVKVATFTEKQKELLLDLVNEWVGIVNESAAAEKMVEIKSHLSETYFAWSGPTVPGSAAYFRIQGPTLLIEYAPQNLGGNPLNHIHTIYRDPTNDYGKRYTAK
ncbi:MAG TPA: DUF3500 domain-containing protein [Candidatus Limnocylindria bacterium]|jgi:hypothetical protein|nr:DUF3500 domain-containing protein [Candidatus Limnocylindria bacterium]